MRCALLAALLLLAACGAPGRCLDRGDCGELQVCEDATCRAVACVASADCAIGMYCHPGRHTCEVGCASDADCVAGESCDADGTCSPYGCRSTALDCRVGERCDLATGTCFASSACEPCGWPTGGTCGEGACADFLPESKSGNYCLMPCFVVDDPEQCPRGLACQDLSGAGDLYCYAWCPALRAELEAVAEGGG